jgi:hypothetical protein
VSGPTIGSGYGDPKVSPLFVLRDTLLVRIIACGAHTVTDPP